VVEKAMNRSAEQVRIEWLVLRSQTADRAAFDELIALFQPRLLKHARYLSGRDDAAHDIVQESWIAIVRGIDRIDDPATFRAWAYRIVTNKSTDRVRSLVRERAAIEQRPEIVPEAPNDDESSVRKAMARLGPDQRAILSLRYLEDMSTREIAGVLEIPAGTVKSRLHQARNELKTILERSAT
jgi:RNA polymerase sigma-70 factor (ECF subfamily)